MVDYLTSDLVPPMLIYWLCLALSAHVKSMDLNHEHAKRVLPYIVKTATSAKFGSLEDTYAILSLLGDLIIRFPGAKLVFLKFLRITYILRKNLDFNRSNLAICTAWDNYGATT